MKGFQNTNNSEKQGARTEMLYLALLNLLLSVALMFLLQHIYWLFMSKELTYLCIIVYMHIPR